MPEDVYNNGLPLDKAAEWERKLERKGRIPYIRYPVVCAYCGTLWPDLFMVPDEEWEHYIAPNMRRAVICRTCYEAIKECIDSAKAMTQEESVAS